MISADTAFATTISRWAGSPAKGYLSLDPNDNGNWYLPGAAVQKKGQGQLVGSNYDVTGATLAAWLGRPNITPADIKNVSLATACAIARKLFYVDPGLSRLAWNRATWSIVDFGWGSGPVPAIKLLQDMLNVGQDGKITSPSGETASAWSAFVAKKGEVFAAGAWFAMREEYYEDLVARRPSDGMYLGGWDNRADWLTPGHAERTWEKAA